MAENIQPGIGAGDRQAALTEYNRQRQTLKELLSKRKQQERHLHQLEQNIAEIETKYLANSRLGNIVKGFENYIKGTSSAAQRKQGEVKDEDYIWSRSSISYNANNTEYSDSQSATSTPAAPTPVSTTFANSHKDKDGGSNQPTPTSATAEKGPGKAGKAGKKRTTAQARKDKDADADDSETDSRETKKARTHFGATRK
ncbi:NuA4-domain-containing protein [Durotheca rogersii]|uniref:NuA4-domain-containing protein n=1 Tax=Durotheca rogersii TaxID=419775 RepID=UPI00221F87E2|nr:NuA4-domain-containing protein [Durotheca rogersii]KAI5862167.1 NuA4-domain-containing protein [Durotheca rogersii]